MIQSIYNPDNNKKNISIAICGVICFILFFALILGKVQRTEAESAGYNESNSIYPVSLDLKLIDVKSKIIGSNIINERELDKPYTIVETVFTARARALGGDLYLPVYREDIVSKPIITVPEEGSNAVLPSASSIEVLRTLPEAKGKYLLHEYEEAVLRIKIVYKILPKAMPSKLVFSTKLNTVLWYPATYENGQNDPGFDPITDERLNHIALINAAYIPQQMTKVDWQTEPVILLRDNPTLSMIKSIFENKNNNYLSQSLEKKVEITSDKTQQNNIAQVPSIFERLKKILFK